MKKGGKERNEESGVTHQKLVETQLQANGKVKDEAKTRRAKANEPFFGHRERLIQISMIRHSSSSVQVENISDFEHHRQYGSDGHHANDDETNKNGREDACHLSLAGYSRPSIGNEHR